VIPNGISIQQIDSIQSCETGPDLIFTGRLIREKKADLLIGALARVKEEIPDISCAIIGDGPERARLVSLSEEYGLVKNVRLTGFLKNNDDVISMMKSSKVFVSPSVREGFGIAALEALACGLPVVTTSSHRNAVRELVGRTTGRICPLSAEAFAESILYCLENKNSMTHDCRQTAERYDWELIVENLERTYMKYSAG
jgi:L-malate glycosyltransferase